MATFQNRATLSYNGNITTSNTVSGEVLEVLSATKTAVMDTYTANDDVTYVVTIKNTGNVNLTGLELTDNLGEYELGTATLHPLTYTADSINYYINGDLQTTAPTVTAGPPLEITGISVPAGGNAMLIYEARVNQFAPLAASSTISNTVTITGAGITTPVVAVETISTLDIPELIISKALTPTTIAERGEVTYTFSIQNYGNTQAADTDRVVLTDTFNRILDPIRVRFGTTNWVEDTDYTYSNTTGVFESVAGKITVPAATYTQDATTGVWTVVPGVSTLYITGTLK